MHRRMKRLPLAVSVSTAWSKLLIKSTVGPIFNMFNVQFLTHYFIIYFIFLSHFLRILNLMQYSVTHFDTWNLNLLVCVIESFVIDFYLKIQIYATNYGKQLISAEQQITLLRQTQLLPTLCCLLDHNFETHLWINSTSQQSTNNNGRRQSR